jgi:segregation and condensation protein B
MSDVMIEALRLAEAVVFAATQPVTPRVLAQILPEEADVDAVMSTLTESYAQRGVNLIQVGGGWQFRTAPDVAPQLRKVVELPRRLPRVAMESLAIIAYHQPVTRPEIEEIRGAALSQATLDLLLENGLITPKGRKESPGRPTLWGTTPAFLAQFGLNDLRDLPKREELLIDPTGPALKEPESVLAGRPEVPGEEPQEIPPPEPAPETPPAEPPQVPALPPELPEPPPQEAPAPEPAPEPAPPESDAGP